ncbi:hypothetical protein DFP72DRAFT_1072009 [Ephemerocybe angulata]|uniref:Uncharacterized protein n=1 Tax=Ephemerocybe angulata TaxID=980116 RepID=A0A8H6HQH6_9AGAR|nr:hypothetical protein DFP72DRAFT_1072009 [Tulosesus angulatus]
MVRGTGNGFVGVLGCGPPGLEQHLRKATTWPQQPRRPRMRLPDVSKIWTRSRKPSNNPTRPAQSRRHSRPLPLATTTTAHAPADALPHPTKHDVSKALNTTTTRANAPSDYLLASSHHRGPFHGLTHTLRTHLATITTDEDDDGLANLHQRCSWCQTPRRMYWR